MPLKKAKKTKNLTAFMDRNIAKGYFFPLDGLTIDTMYINAITPLIHGSNMDVEPLIITKDNIKKANAIINEWKKENPTSVYLQFENAWVKFLKNDYNGSIKIANSILEHLDEVPVNMKMFVNVFYWRNLGFAYDMIGKRKEAINAYKECKKMCVRFNVNEENARQIYKNFENEPYKK
ncbi:MAG: tetratricopeptide repeat protein [Treponema sp.]